MRLFSRSTLFASLFAPSCRRTNDRKRGRSFPLENLEPRIVLSAMAVEPVKSAPLALAPSSAAPATSAVSTTPAAAPTLPVLLVVANQDFYFKEYADTRAALVGAGLTVKVAAATKTTARPHANSGQVYPTGNLTPDLALADASASNYSAVVFVGGWGASSYQYAFSGTYQNAAYNGSAAVESQANTLINDFVAQDKYVAGICHGVTVLAWARVGGKSLLDGKTVVGYEGSSPAYTQDGVSYPNAPDRNQLTANKANVLAALSVGNTTTATDDVWVDGKVITGQNWDSAKVFGQTVAAKVKATTTPIPDPTSSSPLPVLLVVANQDFYFKEYADTRSALVAAGLTVKLAAATNTTARPHANSGQVYPTGNLTPDLALADASASNYSAVVFVGGWGASSYQYAFSGTYQNATYNGNVMLKNSVNMLINDFVAQDKYVAAICHGVSVLAWARVNGTSPLQGKTVVGYEGSSPAYTENGVSYPNSPDRNQLTANNANVLTAFSVGNAQTATDDVWVDGKVITAENWDSATLFGQTIAAKVKGTTSAAPLPVLMVIANQDFYYKEYADTCTALVAAGVSVVVAAETTATATPHANSGQGAGTGNVMPDIALMNANASNYSAIVFVGGWGASDYQYAFAGTYQNAAYNSTAAFKGTVNNLINSFVSQDKYVAGICHGVSVLAWARVNGTSLLDGKTVVGYEGNSPVYTLNGVSYPNSPDHDQLTANNANVLPAMSVGNAANALDDVFIDGKIITGQNWDSATLFGQTIATQVKAG